MQRGDSFYLIARKFGISVRALMNANPNIAAGHLLVGDILCVAVGEGRSCPVGSSAYTVQQGQSVVDVMRSSDVSLRALREYNEDIRLTALRPGDVLCVPPSGDRGLCENGGPVHRLQEGDTLDEIAERNGTNVGSRCGSTQSAAQRFCERAGDLSADKAARNRGKHGRTGNLIYITKRSGPCGFAPFLLRLFTQFGLRPLFCLCPD